MHAILLLLLVKVTLVMVNQRYILQCPYNFINNLIWGPIDKFCYLAYHFNKSQHWLRQMVQRYFYIKYPNVNLLSWHNIILQYTFWKRGQNCGKMSHNSCHHGFTLLSLQKWKEEFPLIQVYANHLICGYYIFFHCV